MPNLKITVEVEEQVYRYTPADNGSSPMWTQGNTCIVRWGDELLASGIETLSDYRPLNNVRWTLFQRNAHGWRLRARGDGTHEREPCPLVIFPDGRVFLSVHPNDAKPGEFDGAATPQLLEFDARTTQPPKTLTPAWDNPHPFHGHTYRSFAADAGRGECILFYTSGYDRADWTFRDAQGNWSRQGALAFPWGGDYEKPQPIRICYPNVAMKNGAVYFCGVSDIIEPKSAWRARKKEISGKDWDYDFRRLFYTWCDDIRGGAFHEWVEVASREATCGWILPCDMHIATGGEIHLLWHEKAIDERLRAEFFPGARQSIALNHAVVRDGQVVAQRAVAEWRENNPGAERPGRGRFHVTPDGRLLVIYYVEGTEVEGQGRLWGENRIVEIGPAGPTGRPVPVPLAEPIPWFYTATARAGCAPSDSIDIFGDVAQTMRYAQVRVLSH